MSLFTEFMILLTVAGVIASAYVALQRLFWSPLSKFPGPTLAALTLWYEFYFDVVRGGMYIWEIKRLHDIYGPIVRISPYELHISDPDFYSEIYASNSRIRDKYSWKVKSGDSAQAMGFTVPRELHRERRQAVDRFFSIQSVAKLEDIIQEDIERLCARMEHYKQSGKVINLTDAFLALTMDIIQVYSFGESSNLVDLPNFSPEWRLTIMGIMSKTALINHCGWVAKIVHFIPQKIIEKTEPSLAMMLRLKSRISCLVKQVAEHRDAAKKPKRRTIFDEILNDEHLSAREKTVSRLTDEASILVMAASETTGRILAIIVFHLSRRRDILEKIREELRAVPSSTEKASSLHDLERLPYLSGAVKEGLRLHGGIVARSQRVCRNEALHYGGFTIPPGTPISTSSYFVHRNPKIFPKPSEFIPERWINHNETYSLDRYLVAFGRGTRNCVGRNLGKAELYLTVSKVIKRFDFEPFETTEDDVDIGRDWYVPQPLKSSEGVRAIVKESSSPSEETLAIISSSPFKAYEGLPVELQYDIVNHMNPTDRSTFCLVNRHAYALTLPWRYRAIHFQSPEIATAFSRHFLHSSNQSLSFVRDIMVCLPPCISPAGVGSLESAFNQLPRDMLQTFRVQISSGAEYASPCIFALLYLSRSVRTLSITYPEDMCFGQLDLVELPNLEHLILHATRSARSGSLSSKFVEALLRRTCNSIKKLDVGSAVDCQGPFEGTSLQPLNEVALALQSVTFRGIRFNGIDWRHLAERGLGSLMLSHCPGCLTTLENLSGIAPSWSSLRSLILVLPQMQMQLNPSSLQAIELLLGSLPCHSLQYLCIQAPAAGRMPEACTITRHQNLRSLIVAVTNENGRWLAFPDMDLKLFQFNCIGLQCLGLSLPSPEGWSDFFKSIPISRITSFLVIGNQDPSPHPSAPAWVQHCANRSGVDQCTAIPTVQNILRSIKEVSETENILRRLQLRYHIGPYYCRDWAEEMGFPMQGNNA